MSDDAAINPKPMLTERQQDVLDTITSYIADVGIPPTREDLSNALGINLNAVQGHIRTLARKGFIDWLPRTSRGIQVKKS